jgi:hypothetical protein
MTDHRSEYDILAGRAAVDERMYDPDPLTVIPEDDPAPLSLVRWGCGICLGVWLAALVLLASTVLDATPRGTAVPSPPDLALVPATATADVRPVGSGGPFLGVPQYVTGPVESYPGGRFPAATLGGTPQPALASAGSSHPGGASGPAPTAAIGTAIWTASATWCKPTPTQCRRWGGDAHLAALPTFHDGDPNYLIRVCHGSDCTLTTVVSWCRCGVDLSPAAFLELGVPLSRGRVQVEVEGPIGLPATDSAAPLSQRIAPIPLDLALSHGPRSHD